MLSLSLRCVASLVGLQIIAEHVLLAAQECGCMYQLHELRWAPYVLLMQSNAGLLDD